MLKLYKRFFILILIAALTGILPIGLTAAKETRPNTRSGRYIVKFRSKLDGAKARKITARREARLKRLDSKLKIAAIDVSADPSALNEIKKDPAVAYIEPDYLAYAAGAPNDPYYYNQWGLENSGQTVGGYVGLIDADIDAEAAWDAGLNGQTNVAVLDTGIDQDHEEFAGKIAAQANFTSSPNADDYYGHGTHVAGIIAASSGNGQGISGACPSCRLLNVKVLDDSGAGYHSWIAGGIVWAADNGAKVINLSLGGPSSYTMQDAINYAAQKGVVIVAAAGNSGSQSKTYPAAYPNVIAVAATDNRDYKASFSNYGADWVDVAAPGVNVLSALPNHSNRMGQKDYGYLSGTSMSTPLVAAIAGLVWQSPYGSSASEVRAQIENSSDRTSSSNYWAYGRVNAAGALAEVTIPVDTVPPAAPYIQSGGVKYNQIIIKWNAVLDNVGVKEYNVYRDGQLIGTTPNLSYNDDMVTANTSYRYNVSAVDAAGNVSLLSNTLKLTTKKSGSFTGRVTSRSTGQPVGGARLQFVSAGITTIVYTNLSGEYVTPVIQAGSYKVTISKSGFRTRSFVPYLSGHNQIYSFKI